MNAVPFTPVPTPDGAPLGVEPLALLFDQLSQQVVTVGQQGEVLYGNPSWLNAVGLGANEVRSVRISDLVAHPYTRRWSRWLEDPGKLYPQTEVRLSWQTPGGEERPVVGSVSGHGGDLGPVRLMGVFQDNARFIALQATLREQEAIHQLLSNHAPVGVFQTDGSGRLVRVNARWQRIAGFQHTDSPRGVWWQMVAEEDRKRVVTDWESFLRHGHEFVCEFRVNTGTRGTRFARTRIVQASPSPEQEVACVGVTEDITKQRRLEVERLEVEARSRQQQRLESIGNLASGVAHEINNPLMGISNYAQLIHDEAIRNGPVREYAEEILRETGRITYIVRNLLTFARQDTAEHGPAELDEIVEETLSLARTIIQRDHVELQAEIPAALPVIWCRSQQIQQVLMNLLTNGRDALNEKYSGSNPNKVLRVTASASVVKGRPWVRITVEDHGVGIPSEVVERMYEPFFTTKGRNKGTGLGLSISLGIVHEHGGGIRVETQPGEYTRFHVDLPAGPPQAGKTA
jgi:PAS domain S-box-containing protein